MKPQGKREDERGRGDPRPRSAEIKKERDMSFLSNPGKVVGNIAKKAKPFAALAPALDVVVPGVGTGLGLALKATPAGIGSNAKKKKDAKTGAVPATPASVAAPTPGESVAADGKWNLPTWAMPAGIAALAVLVLGAVFWFAKKK
ncbi:MAG: hypothetical protein RLZZ182_1838 [Pseudomonadota bacterium]